MRYVFDMTRITVICYVLEFQINDPLNKNNFEAMLPYAAEYRRWPQLYY